MLGYFYKITGVKDDDYEAMVSSSTAGSNSVLRNISYIFKSWETEEDPLFNNIFRILIAM